MFFRVICEPMAISAQCQYWRTVGRTATLTERVLCERIANEVCLEQRTHFGIVWSRMIQDHEVNLEEKHIDKEWQGDEAGDACSPVPHLFSLWGPALSQSPGGTATTPTLDILRSPNFSHRSSIV